jgi:hypothetical protein
MEGVSLCGAQSPSFYPFTVTALGGKKDNELLWGRKITKNWDVVLFSSKKFLLVEGLPNHVLTVWIFNPSVSHMQFLLSKNGLCKWISAYPLVEIDDFLKVPHLLWAWDFVDM